MEQAKQHDHDQHRLLVNAESPQVTISGRLLEPHRHRPAQEDHRTRAATGNVLTSTNITAWTHARPGGFRRSRRSNPRFRIQLQHQLRNPGRGHGRRGRRRGPV